MNKADFGKVQSLRVNKYVLAIVVVVLFDTVPPDLRIYQPAMKKHPKHALLALFQNNDIFVLLNLWQWICCGDSSWFSLMGYTCR